MKKKKIILAIAGASGSIYPKLMLDKLLNINPNVHLEIIFSKNAQKVWKHELPESPLPKEWKIWGLEDFNAPFASGSSLYDSMVILPCSMGMLGRIASGTSNDLISRTADVMLKERRKLILVLRDTPYNHIHINNMSVVSTAGAIVCPATPSFYGHPKTIEALCMTVVDRILDLLGIPHQGYRWTGE